MLVDDDFDLVDQWGYIEVFYFWDDIEVFFLVFFLLFEEEDVDDKFIFVRRKRRKYDELVSFLVVELRVKGLEVKLDSLL